MDFPGVAFVTGAGSGIGRQTALLYAKEGCRKIAICDINMDQLTKTSGMIKSLDMGTEVKCEVYDISDERSVQEAIEGIVSHFGRLDYCANIAGIVLLGVQTADMTSDFFDKHQNVNLRGVFFCERAQLQAMMRQEPLQSRDSKYASKGSIVNVSSMSGLVGSAQIPAYAVSKYGVVGLSKSDGLFYGKYGIRINTVCPGAVATPILVNSGNSSLQEPLADADSIDNSMKRFGDAEEIAQAIVWLSSGRASYINATVLACNGGMIGA
jgi:NAD(P)-dependent dehydrogenase (short-subunit alcohol dehydrogenase family)